MCSRSCSPRLRLKLFEAVVAPVVLYGSACWTVTQRMAQRIRSTQRRMLRLILGSPRRPEEEWADYMKRTTHYIEELSGCLGYESWDVVQRRRKFRFAGRVARSCDDRWARRMLQWTPWFRLPSSFGRRVGRPTSRWLDDLNQFAGSNWIASACDAELWKVLENGYAYKL